MIRLSRRLTMSAATVHSVCRMRGEVGVDKSSVTSLEAPTETGTLVREENIFV